MKTIIVGLDGLAYAPNFNCVPPAWKASGVRVVVHSDPRDVLFDGELVANCDVALSFGVELLRVEPRSLPYLALIRASKRNQIDRINGAGVLQPNFRKLVTNDLWQVRADLPYPSVIKPTFAARGIGQLLLPEYQDLETVKLAIANCTTTEELLAAIPNTVFSTHGEHSEGEGLRQLRQSSKELLIQEYIPNIDCEMRLLVAKINGEYRILYRGRTLTSAPFPQASDTIPCDPATGENTLWVEEIYKKHRDEIVGFVKDLDPIFGSVDIFFTTTGEWGCFEYQPEFSSEGFGIDEVRNLHMDFITSFALKFNK